MAIWSGLGQYGYLVLFESIWLLGLAWVDMAIWSGLGRYGYLIWFGSILLLGLACVDMPFDLALVHIASRSCLGQNGSTVLLGLI